MYKEKISVLYFMIIAGFMLLICRLWYLQFYERNEFIKLADDNTIRHIPMPAERGLVFSSDGEILVKNSIYFKASLLSIEVENISDTLDKISTVIPLSVKEIGYIKKKMSEYTLDPVIIKDMLDYGTFCRLAEIKAECPGLLLEVQPVRDYPFGVSACHVLGYDGPVSEEEVNNPDNDYSVGDFNGKDGVEKEYDERLRGKKGSANVRVNAAGRLIDAVGVDFPIPGDSVFLTIDSTLQLAAEKALRETIKELELKNGESSGGAAVVLNAKTGAVLAMASYPVYDPNKFARGISQKDYDDLINNKANPLLNRPIHGAYPCASTFKIITSSAALQEGLAGEHDHYYCKGFYDLQGHVFNCFVTSGHGWISFEEALAYSCDVVYYEIASRFKIEKFLKYIADFGIGSKTGIDLPGENSGHLPSEQWKIKTYGEPWYPGDTVNLSIGQGFVEVTPLQVARFTMAVANGGYLYRPYIVDRIESAFGNEVEKVKPHLERRLSIDERFLAAVRRGMRGAVSYGSGRAADCEYAEVAGKTGTAENFPTPENPKGLNHTWFTSFAPYGDPEIVATVLLEKSGGYGGELSAKIAKKIYDAKFK